MTDTQTPSLGAAATAAGDVPEPSRRVLGLLSLLAPAALHLVVLSAILVVAGPSEKLETRQWALAFLAVPGGLVIANRQAKGLDEIRAAWSTAAAVLVIALALLLRSLHPTGDTRHFAYLFVAGALALAAPWLVRTSWVTRRTPTLPPVAHAYAFAGGVVFVGALLFVPDESLTSQRLVHALVLGAVALGILLATARFDPPRRVKLAIDLVLAGSLALIVMSLPDIRETGYALVHHQNFYLGPVNDAMHGRPVLDGTWSQYGVADLDALRLAFGIVPIGYGGLALIAGGLTVLQYLLTYVTLRMAIRSQLLIVAIFGTELVAHILGLDIWYLAVPSTSPLRFGLPYLVIALAVFAAHRPAFARGARIGQYVVLGLAAVWAFEALIYTTATFGLIIIATELAAGPGAFRRIVRSTIIGALVVAAAIAIYTLIAISRGGADWSPYFDFIRLYSVEGFGQLPVELFSMGPVVGLGIFLSVVGTVHLARTRSPALTPEQLAALAGFGGAALSFYTYYLGRSSHYNLLNTLLPTVVLGGLWAAVLLQARPSTGRLTGLAALTVLAAGATVIGWPVTKQRWPDTAFAQAVPFADGKLPGDGLSVVTSLRRIWRQPVFDSRAATGQRLLNQYLPSGAPALVITAPDLATEMLVRSHRANLLPISNAIEDDLLPTLHDRVRKAAEKVPAGTLMLTGKATDATENFGVAGQPGGRVSLQLEALAVLHRRFRFRRVEKTPDGVILVRLEARTKEPVAPKRP